MHNTSSTDLPRWRLLRFDEVGSTNDIAGKQPGWTAVVARRQVAGRGRYRRAWVSDEGGIWVSAVLPTPQEAEAWSILPLAAGWALRAALESLGVQTMRLRWPNDLMVGPAKLAGILVERFTPETAVIGIGINYDNDPATVNPELKGSVTRLADLLDPLPSRDEVLGALLAHLAVAQGKIAAGRSAEMLPDLNRAWQIKRVQVSLQPDGRKITGEFFGVDVQGRLLVRDDHGQERVLSPLDVELLREV